MTPVSVIIPCYNAAATLEETVDSVHAQDIPGIQIVIVDDVSQDDTVGVATRLAQRHSGTVVLRRSVNGGAAAARNVGFQHAAGVYVTFLDADDLFGRNWLRLAIQHLQANPAVGALACGIELIDSHRPVSDQHLAAMANSLPSNVVVRADVVDLIGGFPEDPAFRGPTAGEDIQFRHALRRWFGEQSCTNRLFHYRVRRGSHFDRFLDNSYVEDGRLKFHRSPELATHDQAMAEAQKRYQGRIRARLATAARALGVPPPT